MGINNDFSKKTFWGFCRLFFEFTFGFAPAKEILRRERGADSSPEFSFFAIGFTDPIRDYSMAQVRQPAHDEDEH